MSSVQLSNINNQNDRLEFLQALRGLAALSVVLFHGSRFISPYYQGLGWRLFGGGSSMGVDLFFVISGFIMVYTTRQNTNALDFGIRRFSRVWPAYAVLTLACIFIIYGQGFWSNPQNITKLIASLTFIPLSGSEGVLQYPVLNVGWTLNYEAYFYLIFGLSLLFGRYRYWVFFSYVVLSLWLLPLVAGLSPPSLSPAVKYGFSYSYITMATNPIVWLFVAGVVIGLIYQSRLSFSPYLSLVIALTACTLWIYQYAGFFMQLMD